MKFTITRDALLKPLNLVAGVVERRHTLPILANVLLAVENDQLSIMGTDLEVQLLGRVTLDTPPQSTGDITVPAKKLLDICKSLPEGSVLDFSHDGNRLILRSGRSRFTLSTLEANDFPSIPESPTHVELSVKQGALKRLIERTSFAMAQQDVRYYLNGMLWEIKTGMLRAVATDGHRLAMCGLEMDLDSSGEAQVILPRKGVIELAKLLMDEDETVSVIVGDTHFRATTDNYTFTSKLVDGKFPDYERVLPRSTTKIVLGSRQELRNAFSRTAILSNEKYRGIRMLLSDGQLQIVANNPEQEEAEEIVSVDYQGDSLEIGFNVSYLLDVLAVLSSDTVKLSLSDPNSSALLEEGEDGDSVYVVMPMRL